MTTEDRQLQRLAGLRRHLRVVFHGGAGLEQMGKMLGVG
jgi:hypothetical protein